MRRGTSGKGRGGEKNQDCPQSLSYGRRSASAKREEKSPPRKKDSKKDSVYKRKDRSHARANGKGGRKRLSSTTGKTSLNEP